ncbi:DUF2085 domain-containing protein [Candidatus Altiarchaeota archaeon]
MSDNGGLRGKDFFEGLMGFLEGGTKSSVNASIFLEKAWKRVLYNSFAVFFLILAALVILIIFSPLLILSDHHVLLGTGALIHIGGGVLQVCHQLPYRSFIFSGVPLPVCARDIGLYVGTIAGLGSVFARARLPEFTRSLKFTIACMLPIIIDGVTQTVLHLRESNNLLRLLTGLLFAYGVLSFFANRIFLWKFPDFLEYITIRSIMVDAFVVLIMYSAVFIHVSAPLGDRYVSRDEAIGLAGLKVGDESRLKTFYIPALTSLSIQDDPFYGSHRDMILDDLRQSTWAQNWRDRYLFRDINTTLDYFNMSEDIIAGNSDNISLHENLLKISEREHRFGIWVLVLLDEQPRSGDAPFISSGAGEYTYIDAYSGKAFDRRKH